MYLCYYSEIILSTRALPFECLLTVGPEAPMKKRHACCFCPCRNVNSSNPEAAELYIIMISKRGIEKGGSKRAAFFHACAAAMTPAHEKKKKHRKWWWICGDHVSDIQIK